MKADWEEVKNGDVLPQHAGIHVSMNTDGNIVMGRVTYEMLKAPPAFNIYFDKANKRIGLKPASLSTRNAYPARVSNCAGAKMVRGLRLMREQRIVITHTLEFPDADIDEDGILVLDLRTAVPSNRARAAAAARRLSQNNGKR